MVDTLGFTGSDGAVTSIFPGSFETYGFTGGTNDLQVISNQIGWSSEFEGGVTKIAVPADFNIMLQAPSRATGYIELGVVTSGGGTGGASGFNMMSDHPSGGEWLIERIGSGAGSLVTGTNPGGSISNGEWIRFSRSGTTLRAWTAPPGSPDLEDDGDWDMVLEVTGVSTDPNPGVIYFGGQATATRLDNLSWVTAVTDPPENVTPPVISGTAQEGETLTCTTDLAADWEPDADSAAYQWQRRAV